jgi:hypothetical protein
MTPFPVEYGRLSGKTRAGAPTVVPHAAGCPVKAEILVLADQVSLEHARNLLWRRELRKEGTAEEYIESQSRNAVVVRDLPGFCDLDHVLFTDFNANGKLDHPDPRALAQAAIDSVAKAPIGRDGISYLIYNIKADIVTTLTPRYQESILALTNASDLAEALDSVRERTHGGLSTMNTTAIFCALSSRRIAGLIRDAEQRICYVAPGIQDEPAVALVELAARSPTVELNVSVDFDERTLRMGYGSLSAVERLRGAGILVGQSSGFRSAVLIIDERGWVFSPTALYLEAEPLTDETPNALHLTKAQVQELLIRLSPESKRQAVADAETPDQAARIEATRFEGSQEPIKDHQLDSVRKAIEIAPPVSFDVVRQVRVFEPYLQYVELTLSGAAIQRHRIRVPRALQSLGAASDLAGRLRTTFDLVEKSSQLSSRIIEDQLNEIRKNFTPSLGKDHGRVVLKSAKPHLVKRLAELRKKLEAHQKNVQTELQAKLDESREQVLEYYLPLAQKNPPDALLGQLLTSQPDDKDIRNWIDSQLKGVFPAAKDLIQKMSLEERFKDVTFETLDRPDFLESVKNAFPRVDWEEAYEEFKAAGETTAASGAL